MNFTLGNQDLAGKSKATAMYYLPEMAALSGKVHLIAENDREEVCGTSH